MKNIHEAAAAVLALPELPDLKGNGLCYMLNRYTLYGSAYVAIGQFMETGVSCLPGCGLWTEQRLNIICLLAITSPKDFE